SVIGTASSRMPTMTALITSSGTTSTSGTTTSTLLANADCIEAYTSCMKGGDACGSDFEECTNKVLFHGKMPQCLSTLAQCSTAGVTSLFGTGTVTALSTVATKNSYGEVTDYTYPTDGSVLGQLITGAAISNKYDTSTCVKRYTSCLKKDSVCGNDFELCTTDKEFRKQRVFCDSTLARCQSEGLIELFGSANTSATPSSTSRIGEMIAEGAALAAVNAVATCYKVVDQCILNACATNPYKCFENSTNATVSLVEAINSGVATAESTAASTIANVTAGMDIVTKSNVASYIKNSCLDTIGSNKYCYATFLGNGQMPTASQLRDEDNQEEIYDEAYAARMSTAMKAKISDLVDQFDTKAKQKCTETIKTCVMRVCGSGSGAACYSQVFGNRDKSINNSVTYPELQTGCAAVVNTDAYCKYAAANPNTTGGYTYSYINNDAFSILFPEYESGGNDPIGVISALNATLASSYSDAAIATMKRQCQAVATSCVKSMCGADYQNCYRNRTDVYSSLTSTGDSSFDKSMNKVGGVLDYTIVLGLCLDTVKNASVCEEHLAIERNKLKIANNSSASVWGGANSTREGWIDAGSATAVAATTEQVAATDENGNALCTSKGGSDQGTCYSVDAAGNIYDQPVYISYTTYVETQAASTLFKDLIYDLEKEAQAKYNAKLTKQQNMCMSSNQGGILGKNDMGSTFLWVKLKSNTVPKAYPVSGLKPTQFAASNDLYGSFCRVRITLQSDDKKIQDVIAKGTDWSTAYFAAGDTFTCGSWIPESALTQLANAVAADARADEARGNGRTKAWMAVLGTVAGGGLGAVAGNKIADSNFLGGLTGQSSVKDNNSNAESCVKAGDNYATTKDTAYLTRMLNYARKIDTSKSDDKEELTNAISNLREAMMNLQTTPSTSSTYTDVVKEYIDGYKQTNSECPSGYEVEYVTIYYADCSQTTGKYTGCGDSTSSEFIIGETKPFVVNESTIRQKFAYKCYRNVQKTLSGTTNTTNNTAELNKKVSALSNACEAYSNNKSSQKTKSISTAIGTGVGAIAGGVLAYQATKSIQDSKLDAAEKAAYDEWMNEVGNHIRCFIGGDEVGMYGDMISTSME
ncbi:MAG: hypothetical protein K2I81_04435, partial [Alphaproteobacteria bacterium]|nr:hypothetical protein [Alphaproteobacteria bacterium]